MFSMVFSGISRKAIEKQREKITPNTEKQIFTENSQPLPERFSDFSESFRKGLGRNKYSESHIYFLSIVAMICKNKYSSFGITQTMV